MKNTGESFSRGPDFQMAHLWEGAPILVLGVVGWKREQEIQI